MTSTISVRMEALLRPYDRADPAEVAARVITNRRVTDDYRLMTLASPYIAKAARPGQFLMMTVARPGEMVPVLPRPMAIYGRDTAAGTIDVVYRIVGEGTRRLAAWNPDDPLTVVGPLGRGFDLFESTRSVLLIGRGIGICSLTMLATEASLSGAALAVLSSARTADAMVGTDLYERCGASPIVEVNDADRTSDIALLRDPVNEIIERQKVEQIFVCGSSRLLELAVESALAAGASVQVSLEAHMACGLGYCHGCSSGHPGLALEAPLVCSTGPVFMAGA